jgi:sulfate permease, SulP family
MSRPFLRREMKNEFAIFPKRISLRVPTINEVAGDFWAGFAAMLVALPSSIAFGVAIYGVLGPAYVAQGALAGVIGAVILGFIAPLLGGAPRLVSSPSAPAAAVMTAVAAELVAGNGSRAGLPAEHVVLLLMILALLAGLLQLTYGLIGGGRLIKYIPYPVISGYISGVGILIILDQAANLFGFSKNLGVLDGLLNPATWQWPSLIIAAMTIAAVVLTPRITSAVPPAILALLTGMVTYLALNTWGSHYFQLDRAHLVIGPIGGSVLPVASIISDRWTALGELKLGEIALVIAPALTLSVLLSIDTLKTCVIVDALTRSRHNSDHELFGQGVANVASSFVGGLPGSGTMGATLVNVHSGAKTKLSGVLEGISVLLAFVLLGRTISGIPIAALAGILTAVAFRMIDRSSLYLLKQKSTLVDFLVIAIVTVVAIRFNLIIAAAVGLGLSILLFMREQIRGTVIRRKLYGDQISSKQQRLPHEKEILRENGPLTTVCQLQGSLFFGTTDQLFTELESDLKRSRYVILDMRRIQSVDLTAANMLDEIEGMLRERGGHLVFTSLPSSLPSGQDLEAYFSQLELVAPSRSAKVFDTVDDALEWTEDRILEAANITLSKEQRPLGLEEIYLLHGIDKEALEFLGGCTEERAYDAGQTIFRMGDSGDELFLIRRGTVRIVLQLEGGRRYNLTAFGRGDFFGDMAFLDNDKRSADAVAVLPAEVFVISRSRFDDIVKRHPHVGVRVFALLSKALAIRLRYANNELRAAHEA